MQQKIMSASALAELHAHHMAVRRAGVFTLVNQQRVFSDALLTLFTNRTRTD